MRKLSLPALLPVLIAVLTLCCLVPARAWDPTRDRILYAVGYSHLDDQWNWTVQDTINSFIPNSCHVNFALLGNPNYTNYTFSFEGAMRYQWIKEYYPADFITLSNYIVQGRWNVAGSMITPSDVNIPAPESLIRHMLLANNYWSRTFGRTPVDLLLPDAFGFGYALPSVAAYCGLKGFSSMRAGPGTGIPLPFQNIGRWAGPDGQSIIAVINPGAYSQPVNDNLANDLYHYGRINQTYAASGLYLDYMYFGNSGDQGGGPSDATVSNVCASVQTTNGLIHVLSASSDQMYRDLTPAQVSQLPAYQGEIVAQTLGTGGYTAHGELKRYNRQCEQQAAAAEAAAVLADWLQGGGTYPQERLNTAWLRFLWHHMYDDLTGVSIPTAYSFTWNDYLLSLNDFTSVETHGMAVLCRALDTTALGVPLLVYNPLASTREDVVDALVTFSNGPPPAVRVFAPNGLEVPSQMGMPSGNTVPVTFLAQVASLGAAVYDVRPSATSSTLNTGLSVNNSQIQNARYLVQLNSNGDVVSVVDKLNNRQLLTGPIRWDFLYDLSTDLPAWEIQYNNIVAAPRSYLSGPADFQVVENGPARVSLAITRSNAGSTFTERIRLAAGNAGDRVEWDISANWHTPQTLLKIEFPLAVANTNATFDLGLGTIQRPNETSGLYEVPAQQWADLTSTDGAYGITIINDCKYGWDKPNNNTLRLTIFHTPAVGSSFPYQASDSFGTHRMLVALMGHTNNCLDGGSPWTAARLNQPLQAFQTAPHAAGLTGFSNTFSFFSCDNSNLMLKALKLAENNSEIVLRLQELSGHAQNAQLSFAAPISSARLVNGAENPVAPLSPINGILPVSVGAYAPLTVAVTLASAAAPVPLIVSAPVSLPFNLDVISTPANPTNGNFDGGYTYPAEAMPQTLVRDGINFQLGPTNDGALNALACLGQTIALPAGYDRLYFLAAAASSNTEGNFTVGGQPSSILVPYFTGFFGQWSPPSILTNQEVAWVCTHRRDAAGHNNAYSFCYLFKFALSLPPGANSLVLPNAPGIRLFALSLATNSLAETSPAGGRAAEDLPPWANAGPSQTVNAATTNGVATVALNGSGSVDPDGFIAAYTWYLNGSLLATGVKPTVTLPLGTNVILLTVTDNQGQTGADETTIVVLPPLIVTLSATPTNGNSFPLTVQFTGQAGGGFARQVYDTTDDHLGAITAQGENNGINGNWEVDTNAFDDNIATKWLDFANSYPSTRSSWIQYQYPAGSQRVVTDYTITSANDAPERDPADWALLGSNDGGLTWATLDVQTNQLFHARYQTQAYKIASPAAFSIYRLRIDRVANPGTAVAVQLSEIQLLGAPLYDYFWSFGDGTGVSTQSADTPDSQQHTYTNNGTYTVTLGASFGMYTGTNTVRITVGPPLTALASVVPANGPAPLSVRFSGQASGGRTNSFLLDTTDDHSGFVTAQGENAGLNGNWEVATNAFDDVTGTKWLDFASSYPNTRQSWIQYQYANGRQYAVSKYTLTSANDAATYPERNPADWHFLGSNDGVSWTTLDVRTNQRFTANYQKLSYNIPNTSAYPFYRLQIDQVFNPPAAVAMQLDELEFMAVPPVYTYWWSFGDGATSSLQNPQHTYASDGTYLAEFVISDALSSVTNWLTITVAPPPLAIFSLSGGQITLTWPSWASNYHLYAATNLAAPISWERLTNGVDSSGTNLMVTIPLDASLDHFFQLRSP